MPGSDHPWKRGHGLDSLCGPDCMDRRVGCREGCERWQEHLRANEERKRLRREASEAEHNRLEQLSREVAHSRKNHRR